MTNNQKETFRRPMKKFQLLKKEPHLHVYMNTGQQDKQLLGNLVWENGTFPFWDTLDTDFRSNSHARKILQKIA